MAGIRAPRPVTFTLDVEDHRPHDGWPERFPALTREVLAFVAERGVRGTVFVVGEIGESHPTLVRDIAAAGHEVGLHAWRHVPLTEVDPDAFREETRKGKAVLEDVLGADVVGFRAPTASVQAATAWVPDVLQELGFRYSSSVIPAHNPLHGWPEAPRDVFRYGCGLTELPMPVNGIGAVALPLLGGVYFRVVPWAIVRTARLIEDSTVPSIYCHPYDFDADEPMWSVPGVGRVGVALLWYNRRHMFAKLAKLLDSGSVGPPLVERLETLPDDLPVFAP
jgi:polysaccharide deacetylase family protein (PEP-CTERM system associated)